LGCVRYSSASIPARRSSPRPPPKCIRPMNRHSNAASRTRAADRYHSRSGQLKAHRPGSRPVRCRLLRDAHLVNGAKGGDQSAVSRDSTRKAIEDGDYATVPQRKRHMRRGLDLERLVLLMGREKVLDKRQHARNLVSGPRPRNGVRSIPLRTKSRANQLFAAMICGQRNHGALRLCALRAC